MGPKTIKHEPKRVYSLEDKVFTNDLTPKAREHLLNSMGSLAAGSPPTPSFRLYGRSDWSLVVEFFKQVQAAGIKVPEWQLTYELSRKTKFGPQGGHPKWDDLREDFMLYFDRPQPVDVKQRTPLIEKYSSLHLKLPKLKDVLPSLLGDDKIQDRASGWPTFDLKKTSEEAQRIAFELARAAQEALLSGDLEAYWLLRVMAYVFSRFNKQKKRIFFPAPFFFMLLEAQFYQPFLKAIQQDLLAKGPKSEFTFWGDKIGFARQFRDIVDPLCQQYPLDTLVFCQRDFEKMDTTMGADQTKRSYNPRILKAFDYAEDSLYGRYLDDLANLGGNMAIATPDGIYTGYHGKASGLETTNGDETCSNEDFDYELQRILKESCDAEGIQYSLVYTAGNGDDGLTIYSLPNKAHDLKRFKLLLGKAAEKAASLYGFRVQGNKWFISDEYGLYCQRMIASIDNHIVDMYPASLILNSIVNPEQRYSPKDWDSDYFDLGIVQKLDNGRNLPYFHALIDFVDNGMKHGLMGSKLSDVDRILGKWPKYRALRVKPFNIENPDDMDDINKSPTLQYLMKKKFGAKINS